MGEFRSSLQIIVFLSIIYHHLGHYIDKKIQPSPSTRDFCELLNTMFKFMESSCLSWLMTDKPLFLAL